MTARSDENSQMGHVDQFLYKKLVTFPVCLELRPNCEWVRYEQDGKYYRIIKDIKYIDISDKGIRSLIPEISNPNNEKGLETHEIYMISWGNISRDETLSSHEFYVHQVTVNSSVQRITEEDFDEKLKNLSTGFEEFIKKSYSMLPVDSQEKKLIQKQKNEQRKQNTEVEYPGGKANEAPF